MTGIYKITVNDKIYIGQSNDILKRWRQHLDNSFRHVNTPLYQDMNNYGLENVNFSILELCPAELLDEREEYRY